ncbi:MAG: TonB-dependent receptor [Calditrichaeota bacterium]|nr:TonB-dependent receptor [Calditrichota bacterium]
MNRLRRLSWAIPQIALLSILLSAAGLQAGITGKVTGTILDARTGEPVANANVVVVNTDFGASSDLEGQFFIINLPPGRYSITASSVGYVAVTQQDVMVFADLTTTLDFQLEPTVIEGQEVIVKAPRKVIRPDVTSSTRIATGDEIYHMPVANYVGALAQVGGAVGSDQNIHIRGGRRGEVAYLIDGMEVKDPLRNLRMLNIGNPAVAEMMALTGGFDAEFGNAQSAVVNVVTREGSKEYHGQARYVFDDLSERQETKFQTTRFTTPDGRTLNLTTQEHASYLNYDYFELSLGGPEPITSRLFPALDLKIPGYLTFFTSFDMIGRNATSNGLWIHSSEWYRHDMSGGLGLDQNREQTFVNGGLALTYHINPAMKLKGAYRTTNNWYNIYLMRQSRKFPYDYSQNDINTALQAWTANDSTYTYVFGADDDRDGRIDEEILNGRDDDLDGRIDEDLQLFEYNAPDHLPTRSIDDRQILLTWSHTLSQRTFYSIKLSRYQAARVLAAGNKSPAAYGEFAETHIDQPDAEGKYNGRYDIGEPFIDRNGNGMWDRGNQANNYFAYRGFLLSGDGTEDDVGQPVPYWLSERSYVNGLKFQITNQMHRNHQLRAGFDYNEYELNKNSLPYPTIDNRGRGIYTDIYTVHPRDGAAYAQDKMEFKDITLTLGLRLDFYMPGKEVRHVMAFDTTNARWNPNYVPFSVPKWIKANLSPRLGASFAISEKSYLHAHYGHFYQRPVWDNLYLGVNQEQTGGTPLIGNPDLNPEKTVAFEVGITYNPYADYLIDITGFLKDVKNWINAREGKYWYPEKFGQPLIGQNFAIYDNQDYAFVRGLEFNFSKEYGSNVSGRLTYTLSWVNAKNSYNIGTQAIRENYVEPPQALPAGWDQRHGIVVNYGLSYGPEDRPFGSPFVPGGWDFNVLWNIRSGLPYTPTDASGTRIEGKYMSERTPWTNSVDFNIIKRIPIVGSYRGALWLQVFNVLDRRNILPVDDNYGRAGSPNAFDDYTGQPGWVNDTVSPNFVLNPYAGPNQDAFDNPRFIRLGLGVDF